MVNEEARKLRHAKIDTTKTFKKTPSALGFSETKASGFNPLLKVLFRRVISCSLVFLIVASFMSTYQLTHGDDVILEGYDNIEVSDQSAESTIADIMTEDGFLLKPAINSQVGDRTGSDIFIYTVEPGDTLSSIAQNFNITKETLMTENNLWNPNNLKAGFKLRILPVDGISHEVKKGDTLDGIVKKYNVKKDVVKKQNELESDTLIADTTLIIPGGKKSVPVKTVKSYSTAPSSVASYSGPKTAGKFVWPAKGQVTQRYHSRHLAIDIANRSKGAIYAAAGGKVIKAATGWNGGYGNVIIIDHGDGMQTLYAHNEKLYVKEGQYVEKGQTISWMGRTGRVYGVTGIHLHFEVRIKGVKYNPMNFF